MTIKGLFRRKPSAARLRKRRQHAPDRAKELNFLFALSGLIQEQSLSTSELLKWVVDLIPTGWQYPEITGARIRIGDEEYQTRYFAQTPWRLTTHIFAEGEQIGIIEVVYLEERPKADKGPFTNEERTLIDAIALQLGGHLAHKEAEEASRKSEEQYRLLFDHANDTVLVLQDGKIVLHNPRAEELTGYSSEEIRSRPFTDFVAPDDKRNLLDRHMRRMEGEDHDSLAPIRVIDRQGTETWVEGNTVRIEWEEKPAGLCFLRDVTDQMHALEELQESEDRYKGVVDNIGIGVALISPDMEILTLNKQMKEWFPAIDPTTKPICYKAFNNPPREDRCSYCPTYKTLEDGQVHESITDTPENEEIRNYRIISSPVRDESGEVLSAIKVVEDITERKQAEQALRESEEKFRTISDRANDAIIMMDDTGAVSFWNRAAENLFGFTAEEAQGRVLHELLVPVHYREPYSRWLSDFQRTGKAVVLGKTIETDVVRKDGTEIPVEFSLSAVSIKEKWNAVGVVRDIRPRKEAERVLKEAKETAEATTKAKSEFLANMSHEIRTPMNGIMGMTDLVLRSGLNEEQEKYLRAVKGSSDHLMHILNDILDFSKIEAGRLELEEVFFDLKSTLDTAMGQIAPKIHDKGLALTCRVDREVPVSLEGDPVRLRQVLFNLLGNAIKFTEAGEIRVECGVEKDDGDTVLLHFIVSDTGIGISKEKQTDIFESFRQADGSMTRQYGGTGLGLTISRNLVELMGGKIWVESEPRVGSSFHFTARFQMQSEEWTVPSHMETTPVPAPDAISRAEQGSLRILLVEDNDINQMMAANILRKWGHAVDVAENGSKALDRLAEDAYSLILMDVQMPVMDGLEATRAIRKREERDGGHVPIIAMTAHAMKGDRERCLESGMDDYLSKPIDPERLAGALEMWGTGRSDNDRVGGEAETPQAFKAASTEGVPIDLEKALARAAGDKAFLEEMLQHFLSNLPDQVRQLKETLEASDTDGLAKQAHSLKGAAGTLGAERIASVAKQLEQTGRAGDLSNVGVLLEELDQELKVLANHVQEEDVLERIGDAQHAAM